MFKIAQYLVFKTRLPIVLQEFNFPCQLLPDKLLQKYNKMLQKYNKILTQKSPWGLGNRMEEEHKFSEEAVDRNSKRIG